MVLNRKRGQDFRMQFGDGKVVAGWHSTWVVLREIRVPAKGQETLSSFSHS